MLWQDWFRNSVIGIHSCLCSDDHNLLYIYNHLDLHGGNFLSLIFEKKILQEFSWIPPPLLETGFYCCYAWIHSDANILMNLFKCGDFMLMHSFRNEIWTNSYKWILSIQMYIVMYCHLVQCYMPCPRNEQFSECQWYHNSPFLSQIETFHVNEFNLLWVNLSEYEWMYSLYQRNLFTFIALNLFILMNLLLMGMNVFGFEWTWTHIFLQNPEI